MKYLGLNYNMKGKLWKKQHETMKNKANQLSHAIEPLARNTNDRINIADLI